MLEIFKKDVPVGSEVKVYLISGENVLGTLEEVGSSYILIDSGGVKKRLFQAFIGGWDIVSKNNKTESPAVSSPTTPILAKVQKLATSLSNDEQSYFFSPNARIISADKKNILVHVAEDDTTYYVQYKLVASEELIKDINELYLSGNDSHNTTIPVYVGLYKSKARSYVNIILQPGTMQEYISILSKLFSSEGDSSMRAKNLTYILWKGCSTKQSKAHIRSLSTALKGSVDKDPLAELDAEIISLQEQGKDVVLLLTRKAHFLSSQNRHKDAISAYINLIEKLKNTDGASVQSISHNYTQLALLQLKINDINGARDSLNHAIQYNPSNTQAKSVLHKLDKSGAIDSHVIKTLGPTSRQLSDFIDSVLIDDMSRHEFSDPEAASQSDRISVTVAERLLMQAESDVTITSYLESAKAYWLAKVSDETDKSNYAKALYGYVDLKTRSIFNALAKSHSTYSTAEIIKLVDSAYCYYVSAINLSSIIGSGWTAHFRDYLRMRIFCFAVSELGLSVANFFDTSIDDFVLNNNLQEHSAFLLECSEVLISIGAKCPVVKDSLYSENGKSIALIFSLINSLPNVSDFYKNLLPSNLRRQISLYTSAESVFTQCIIFREKKLASYLVRVKYIKDRSVNLLFEESIAPAFKRLRKSTKYLTATDYDLGGKVESLIKALPVFKSRTSEEKYILIPSIRAQITNLLDYVNEISSYFCSDLLRELLRSLLKSKNLSVKQTSAFYNELFAETDGDIVENNGILQVPVSISNLGKSTVDRIKAIVSFGDAENDRYEYTNKKNIAPGESVTIFLDIPHKNEEGIYDYTIELSALIMSLWSSPKEFHLTASFSSEISFSTRDIPWNFQAKEMRVEMFKGRAIDIQNLISTFDSNDRSRIPVVFGLTRTGKSSILLNLKNALKGKETEIHGEIKRILPIYIDLGALKNHYKDHESFLSQIWLNCFEEFALENYGPEYQWDSFAQILECAQNNKIYPVFMLDEFSWIRSVIEIEGNEFLKSLREYAIDQKAGFIYAGTYDILDIIRDPVLNPSGAFMTMDEYKIYNIKESSDAEDLIRVMEPKLRFTNTAVNLIHEYSGDVPYWIQLICYHCAYYAIANNRSVIGTRELEEVVKGIIGEDNVKGVQKISDIIFEQQQILQSDPKETNSLLYSIAYLMKDIANKEGVSWSRLKEFWAENEYTPNMEAIVKAKDRLEERLCLLSKEADDTRIYRFSVGLFRRWCARKDVFSELDKIKN